MVSIKIREKLHEYIDTADEKKLEAIYTLLQDNIDSNNEYSNSELAEIYARRSKYKNGEEQVMNTEDFVTYVRRNKL